MSKFIDMEGKKFGKMTVTNKVKFLVGKNGKKYTLWLCRCECGNTKWAKTSYLNSQVLKGAIVSCGCIKVKKLYPPGYKLHNMTLLGEYKKRGKYYYWLCRCMCGKEKWVASYNFRTTKSCGCLRSVTSRENAMAAYGHATKHSVYVDYKKSAGYRSYEFDISFEKFIKITQQKCYFCGCEPSSIQKSKYNNGDFIYNGIDRLNNKKGYVSGNCVPCCEKCNRMKMAMTEKDFLDHIKNIYQFQKQKE